MSRRSNDPTNTISSFFPNRQKSRASQQGLPTPVVPTTKGPDEEKIKAILERTGYTLDVTTGKTFRLANFVRNLFDHP